MPRPDAPTHATFTGERTLMRIHVGEADRYDGRPLYQAIVELLRVRGLAGATVTQCIAGFGATRAIHSWSTELGALDLPVVVECVDEEARIQAVLPELDRMIGGGLITLERAEVVAYRAPAASGGAGGAA
jgi:PII-like signaling protein